MVPSERATDRGTPGSRRTIWGDDRPQANVLGLTLVFGLVIIGSVVVVAFGASAITDSQERLSIQRAEKAMTQFDSQAALVALGNTDIQRIDLGADTASQFGLDKNAGYMRVSKQNLTSGNTTRLVQEDLGAIVYEAAGESLAYQGGGVWRLSGNNSVMVSPPEFHFRNGTLTLPIIKVDGERSLGSSLAVKHNETTRTYPVSGDEGRLNPVTNHKVIVTVKSDYYKAWGKYFETRTDGEVSYDHDENIANLTLVSPIGERKVTVAVSSLSTSGAFTINGASADPCSPGAGGSPDNRPYADSYDSSGTPDDYCAQDSAGTTGDIGNITYGDDIDISTGSGGSPIYGSLRSGGSVAVGSGSGKPYVEGDIYYTDSCNGPCNSKSSGDVKPISGLTATPPINTFVNSTVYDVKSSNDNSAAPISNGRVNFGASGTATLTEGQYYLDRIDFSGGPNSGGNTLNVDTSKGDVIIAVQKDIDVGSNQISVFGDNTTTIYVLGDGTGSGDALTIDGGEISVANDDTPELRVYGQSDFNVTIDGTGYFTGVIYAPPGQTGTGELTIDDGHVFGGAIIGDTTIENQGSIHYDEALKDQQIISRSAKVVKVTYLHISVNSITVS